MALMASPEEKPGELAPLISAVRNILKRWRISGPVVISRLAATSPVTVIATADGHEVRLYGFVAPQQTPIELSAGLGKSSSTQPIVVIKVVDAASGAVLQTASLRVDVPD